MRPEVRQVTGATGHQANLSEERTSIIHETLEAQATVTKTVTCRPPSAIARPHFEKLTSRSAALRYWLDPTGLQVESCVYGEQTQGICANQIAFMIEVIYIN